MRKKLFLTIGTITSLTPLVISGACSTTWTKWSKDVEAPEAISFKKDDKIIVERYAVREEVLNKSAYEFREVNGKREVNVNLSYINNPNELIYVLKKVININLPVNVDDMWKDYTDDDVTNDNRLEKLINDMHSHLKINFVYKEIFVNSTTWDLRQVQTSFNEQLNKTKALVVKSSGKTYYDAIDDYLGMIDNEQSRDEFFNKMSKELKKHDIQLKGLLPDGQPVDVVGAATSAIDLIKMPIVVGLMEYNGAFGFRMAKLTNLYKSLFNSVVGLLDQVNDFIESIFKNSSVNKWITDNARIVRDKYNNIVRDDNKNPLLVNGMDFNFLPVLSEGKTSPAFKTKSTNMRLFKGAFISSALSKSSYQKDFDLAQTNDEKRVNELATYKANASEKLMLITEEKTNRTGNVAKSDVSTSFIGEIPKAEDFIITSPNGLVYKFVSATEIDMDGKTIVTVEITTKNRIYEIPLTTIEIEVDGFTNKTKESEK